MTPAGNVDVSKLPDWAHGPKSVTWWGTLAFCAIEGTGFALAAGGYLFLGFLNQSWPISSPPPDLIWGALTTVTLLASLIPNAWLNRAAHAEDLRRVRLGMVIMSLAGVIALVLRVFEFGALNVKWNQDAYGSTVWVLLGLHATHLVTDLGDTLVLAALMFTRHGHGRRFSDVTDNCFYWNFVVAAWLPLYALIYWAPRLGA
ncbi:cytochrome c oxidase subunit 3 [Hansschlegelia sp.]|uniref:cytochrome c oxidase subunit 3 n=1 Tax=Hansschlegelia sp. TaxID=2041892 RepID=UPI002C706E16|nr:cytochrome c oxidase subunit 3 [Hansschlegelia sp.]HVI28662.1 cytochrome c oxidase subunit 3 [Hansschlegelia sp.]